MSEAFATENCRAVVTGGTSGYGLALARTLADRGATVLVTGRDPDRLAAAEATGLLTHRGDVTRATDRTALLADAAHRLGGLDLLVNNAATQTPIDLLDEDPDTVATATAREVDTDLVAPAALTTAALPLLRASGTSAAVFVTSTLGFAPKQSAPAYCAAKAGLTTYALALRHRLRTGAPHVRSVVVTLPLVSTPMTAGRDAGAMDATTAAHRTVRALARGRDDIDVGTARVFRLLHRAAPTAAGRITRDA